MLDLLIRNGWVVDGSGAARFRADVGVEGDRIVDVDRLEGADAREIIDAAGHVVTPGFVDMHSHTDLTLPVLPTADSLLYQGVTTAVVGQCGVTPAPLREETRSQVVAMMQSETVPLPFDKWSSFGSFLDYLREIGVSVNVVPLVGQATVRSAVMLFSAQPPNAEQISGMQAEVSEAMDAGAIGVSTGLIYPPGSYASTEELVEVTRPAGRRGGYYFSHIRGEGDTLLEAIAEAIRIGRETGAAVQISHFKAAGRANWNKSPQGLALIDQARAEGLDVTTDMYPYLAGGTGLLAVLPEWAQEGGKEAIRQRLADPAARQKIAKDMQTTGFFRIAEWDKVLLSSEKRPEYDGRTVAELAESAGKSCYDWVFDTLLELDLDVAMVIFMMSEDNRRQEMCHPAMMIGTDAAGVAIGGPLAKGLTHPRTYGTYPMMLGRYVRELGVLSLEEAVWKMTGFPAQKLRWRDRGLIRKGFRADLAVVNADTVSDLSTYHDPHHYPAGIPHVIVNGVPVIRNGSHTQARPGRIL